MSTDTLVAEADSRTSIDVAWQTRLDREFAKPYMADLRRYLAERKSRGAVVYPHSSHWFNAFRLTPFDAIKVVILGQDPYHGPGQAHGLSFSVPAGVAPPPSLLNIFRELDSDPAFGVAEGHREALLPRRHGCLESWARQGVFLLNSVLTVEHGKAASHQGRGWEAFTDVMIQELATHRSDLVFLLWGRQAQQKAQLVDATTHHVLRAPHPSPLSAHRGFLGCRHFSAANQWLQTHGQKPIDWHDLS